MLPEVGPGEVCLIGRIGDDFQAGEGREAAADFFECSTFAGRDAFLRGDEDSSDVVQAFAKHRQATEALRSQAEEQEP